MAGEEGRIEGGMEGGEIEEGFALFSNAGQARWSTSSLTTSPGLTFSAVHLLMWRTAQPPDCYAP